MREAFLSLPSGKRRGARLGQFMVLIALIAVALRAPSWLEAVFGAVRLQAEAWDAYLKAKPARDAWSGPVTIRATRQDSLGTVLARFQAATVRPRLKHGLSIYSDTGALREAGRTLESPLGTDLDAVNMPAQEFLRRVLEPLGLACKLHDRTVMVTSEQSLGELPYLGHHGERLCGHGEWAPILPKTSVR